MAGEQQTVDVNTEDFKAFEAQRAPEEGINPFNFTSQPQAKPSAEEPEKQERPRDEKGRFIKQNPDELGAEAVEEGGETDETKKGDTPWLNKRLERERLKLAEKDKEIADLREQLKKAQLGDAPIAGDEDSDVPVKPEQKDFATEDEYYEALTDYFETIQEIGAKQNDAEEEQQVQAEETSEKIEAEAGQEEEDGSLLTKGEQPTTVWQDLLEVLDEADFEGRSKKLHADFIKGMETHEIRMDESMAEWLVANDAVAGQIIQAFVDSPRQSRIIHRAVSEAKRHQLFLKLASQLQGVDTETEDVTYPSIGDVRGQQTRPIKDETNNPDFKVYERQRRESGRDTLQDYNLW